ncbi:MAG TPA: FAD-dependent oxidoreductase [Gaiellaceae bacterium]
MRTADVVVVGAGPGGIGAAIAAAGSGATVVLLDEHGSAGGQFFRGADSRPTDADAARLRELRATLENLHVEVIPSAVAWSIFGLDVLVAHDGRSETITAGAIVLATGAYDRPVPFPGWTLPGVMSAGGAQALLKAHHILPGRRVLLAGAGPFLLPVASALAKAGASVIVAEPSTRGDWASLLPASFRIPSLVRDAASYELALRRGSVERRRGWKLVSIGGASTVESATIARVDREWRAVPGTEEQLDVDTVAIGYGFVPSIELAQLCDCDLRWDVHGQAWFVAVDDAMATTTPGVYAAGEITAVGGWLVAFAAGRIAGANAAAHALTGASGTARPDRDLLRRRAFAARLDRVFAPRPGLWEGLADDTSVVCRCEEVAAGELRERVRGGCTSPKALKDWTRAGMGLCQGRICTGSIAQILAEETGVAPSAVGRPSVRPPVKPIAIEEILMEDLS